MITLAVFCFSCASEQTKPKLSGTDKARLWLEVANTSLMQNDPVGALECIAKAEKEDDSLPEIYQMKGLAFYRRHDLTRAIESVEKALKIKPNYSEANNTLGKFYLDEGKFSAADPLDSKPLRPT